MQFFLSVRKSRFLHFFSRNATQNSWKTKIPVYYRMKLICFTHNTALNPFVCSLFMQLFAICFYFVIFNEFLLSFFSMTFFRFYHSHIPFRYREFSPNQRLISFFQFGCGSETENSKLKKLKN